MSNNLRDRAPKVFGREQQPDDFAYAQQDGVAPIKKPDIGSRQVAKPISIFDIIPDRSQPRRTIPEQLRLHWNGQPGGVSRLLDIWMQEQLPTRPHDEVRDYFLAIVRGQTIESESPTLFDALLDLATDIHRDGLINPVTVAQVSDNRYQLETGERRWLSYHLLYLLTEDERWAKIPARVMERIDRYRQAAENSQRADLNMVARARQWALLMMDTHEKEGRAFRAYGEYSADRDFYGQVLELAAPDGTVQTIMNACGVTSKAMLSKYRDVLRLSVDDWRQADAENWSYEKIEGRLTAVNHAVQRTPPLSKKRRVKPTFEGRIHGIRKDFDKAGEGDRREIIKEVETLLSDLRRIERGDLG